jgi:DNA polymerase-3 subunit beta
MGFEGGGRQTTTRLLEGEFPKYRSLLPSESGSWRRWKPRRSSRRSSGSPWSPSATPDPAGILRRRGRARGRRRRRGAGSEAIPANLTGEEISIAFNPGYLLDGWVRSRPRTRSSRSPRQSKPAVITPGPSEGSGDSEPDADYRYLIMPVRLSG